MSSYLVQYLALRCSGVEAKEFKKWEILTNSSEIKKKKKTKKKIVFQYLSKCIFWTISLIFFFFL